MGRRQQCSLLLGGCWLPCLHAAATQRGRATLPWLTWLRFARRDDASLLLLGQALHHCLGAVERSAVLLHSEVHQARCAGCLGLGCKQDREAWQASVQ